MNIQDLLRGFVQDYHLSDYPNFEVRGLSLDTKKVVKGDVFFAIKGQMHDGRAYLREAIERKACALIVERDNMAQFPLCLKAPIPVIAIDNLHEKISEIAGRYYGDPSHDLTMIGITGTNGKTTSAHILANAMTSLGQPCEVIGTLTQSLTTPDAITLQA